MGCGWWGLFLSALGRGCFRAPVSSHPHGRDRQGRLEFPQGARKMQKPWLWLWVLAKSHPRSGAGNGRVVWKWKEVQTPGAAGTRKALLKKKKTNKFLFQLARVKISGSFSSLFLGILPRPSPAPCFSLGGTSSCHFWECSPPLFPGR